MINNFLTCQVVLNNRRVAMGYTRSATASPMTNLRAYLCPCLFMSEAPASCQKQLGALKNGQFSVFTRCRGLRNGYTTVWGEAAHSVQHWQRYGPAGTSWLLLLLLQVVLQHPGRPTRQCPRKIDVLSLVGYASVIRNYGRILTYISTRDENIYLSNFALEHGRRLELQH